MARRKCAFFLTCGVVLNLVVAIGPARADAIRGYNITNLGARAAIGINNQGQVGLGQILNNYYPFPGEYAPLGNQLLNDFPATLNIYNSFGPGAGTLVPTSSDYPAPSGGNGSTVPWINNTGGSTGVDEQGNAYVLQGGVQQQLGPAYGGIGWIRPMAINDVGQVVGNSFLETGLQPFLYSGGKIQYLGSLGGYSGNASAINNSGVVVGWSDTAGGMPNQDGPPHAFVYQNGKMTDLTSVLGISSSHANAVNSLGSIVGEMGSASWTPADAFLLVNGKATDLNSLLPAGSPWHFYAATGINDLGQIVGIGTYDGSNTTFLLTPSSLGAPPNPPLVYAPEPTSLVCFAALLAAGIGRSLVARGARRTRREWRSAE